ncbi:MAG: hypothetical protein RLZZ511_3501 [Cyanobacteriota bacterium]|jgi:hypothetical protein
MKSTQGREQIHRLYLLKSQEARDVCHAAQIQYHSRVTVQRWWNKYEQGEPSNCLPPTRQGSLATELADIQADHPTLPLRFWAQDATRIGLKTLLGRHLTGATVKPMITVQWPHQAIWTQRSGSMAWLHP